MFRRWGLWRICWDDYFKQFLQLWHLNNGPLGDIQKFLFSMWLSWRAFFYNAGSLWSFQVFESENSFQHTEQNNTPPLPPPPLSVHHSEFRLTSVGLGGESLPWPTATGVWFLHFSSVLSVRMKKKLERCKNQQSQINSEVSWWYGKNVFNWSFWSFWFRILSGCLYLTLLCLFHRDSMQNVTLSSENGLFLHCPRVCYELIDIQSHIKSSSGKRRSILHTNSWSVTLKKKKQYQTTTKTSTVISWSWKSWNSRGGGGGEEVCSFESVPSWSLPFQSLLGV